MTTPMHVYSEIAARYGAKTEEEVDHFFQVELLQLPADVQQAIIDELIDSHGIPSKPMPKPPARPTRPRRTSPPPLRPPMSDDDWG